MSTQNFDSDFELISPIDSDFEVVDKSKMIEEYSKDWIGNHCGATKDAAILWISPNEYDIEKL